MLSFVLLMTFPVAMAFAGANDLFTMRIPNKISLVLIVSFIAAAFAIGLNHETAAIHAAIGAAVLIVTYMLFSFNLLGGGDAKLMAAGALWMGLDHVFEFLLLLTFFGGILAAMIWVYRKFVPIAVGALPGWLEKLHEDGAGMPYGIAIAAAGLAVYPSTDVFRLLSGN